MNKLKNRIRLIKFGILLAIFTLYCNPIIGIESNFNFEHINVLSGLNTNTIYCIFQDINGQMWFGTNDGLITYDIYRFKTWRTDTNKVNTIKSNGVYCIYEDRNNQLWIGTENGLYIFDKKKESFERINGFGIENTLIRSISEDNKGNIWATSLGNGIYKYTPKNKKLRNYRESQNIGLTSDFSTKVLTDLKGDIWCLTAGNYLYKYNSSNDTFDRILIKDEEKNIAESNAFTMCLDSEGNIWVSGWDSGVFHYDIENSRFRNYLMNDKTPVLQGRIHTIKELDKNILYIGSDHGLTLFNYRTNEFTIKSFNKYHDKGLSDNFVYDTFKDKEGGIWVATYFGGINYASPNSSNFHIRYCTTQSEKGRIISKFHENQNGKIFIGTDDGGLFIYDPILDKCERYIVDKNELNLNIHAIHSNEQYLWIGTYAKGLYKVNHKTKKVEHIPFLKKDDATNKSIYSIYEDSYGTIWIGTKNAIWSWTEKGGFTKEKELGFNSDIISICSDSEGNIWFASISKGLLKYNSKSSKITCVSKSSNGEVIPNNIISMSLYKDNLFIGTSGQGLIKYEIARNYLTKERSTNFEMAHLSVYNIINYNELLWLSTNKGLLSYNPSSEKCTVFNKHDGLNTNLFNINSGIATSDGKLYIGSNNGFIIITPDGLKNNTIKPITIFINTSEKKQEDKDYTILYKWHKPLTIEFVSLSHQSPVNNRYKYCLEGYHENWIETNWENNSVTFSNLPCGKYTFRVCSSNNDGVWGPTNSWNIIVKAHWWNSATAISLYIFIGFTVIVGFCIYFLKYNVSKKKNKIENNKHTMEVTNFQNKLDFFFNIVQEIRTPVMLIKNPAEEIANINGLPENIRKNITLIKNNSEKLFNLTDEIIDLTNINTEDLYSTQIVRLTKDIVSAFKEKYQSSNIQISFIDEITDNDPLVNINVNAWNKVVNHLLSNAVKFTKDFVEVRIKSDKNNVIMAVHDNGIGISESDIDKIFNAFWCYNKTSRENTTKFGLGLTISKLLLHNMNMDLNIESRVNEFTTFSITIPLCEKESTDNICHDIKPVITNSNEFNFNSKPKNSIKILIADNNIDFQLYASSLLSKYYTIATASDGEEVLQMVSSEFKPDIIICDVMLPKIDGVNICKHLKNNDNLSYIPIVIISNNNMKIKAQCFQNGAEMVIDKPVDIMFLNMIIYNILDKRNILWESFNKHPYILLPNFNDNNDEQFMQRFSDLVLQYISKCDFTVDDIAYEIHMSRSALYKKVKDITGMTPNNYIKTIRLRRAAELLNQQNCKINEISWLVGFSNHSYFTKCFTEYFGMLPKEYIAKKVKENNDEPIVLDNTKESSK